VELRGLIVAPELEDHVLPHGIGVTAYQACSSADTYSALLKRSQDTPNKIVFGKVRYFIPPASRQDSGSRL
jgi:hypothetical protein